MSLVLTPRRSRAFERALFGDAFGALDRLFTPPPAPALTRREDGYSLELALPGLKAEDVNVTLEAGVITLEATRTVESPEGFDARRRERRDLHLERRFRVPPDADATALTASMTDGLFALSLPFAAAATPRTIPVTEGGA